MSKNENLNLADLDLKKLKLSEEDALALSYLTPGLSRRIQKQLLSQLAPSEVRKLQRTLSSRTSDESLKQPKSARRSLDRISSTLPRRFSAENNQACLNTEDNTTKTEMDTSKESNIKPYKSFLPVKNNREDYRPSYEFNVRSSSIGAEAKGDNKFAFRKPKITKSLSVREPRSYIGSKSDLQSPESSISESLSSSYRNNTDSLESSSKCFSDSSASRPYSKYSSDSSYSRYSPGKSYDSAQSFIPSSLDSNKTDLKKPSSSSRRVSRFLRPDFFDAPKEENVYLKEKKEREMETQKVLKEIRDKRKGRLNLRRERSSSRERQLEIDKTPASDYNKKKETTVTETDKLLSNVSNSIKNLESNAKNLHDYVNVPTPNSARNSEVQSTEKSSKNLQSHDYINTSKALHDYVNVKAVENATPVVKKEKVSRIARPKSYPTENAEKVKVSPEKESKLNKLRKGFSRQSKEKTKEDKNEMNKNINEEEKGHKNKLLQSIEKKLEKFRSAGSTGSKDSDEIRELQEKKSSVENAIKRLREQSLPRNLEHGTESELIKRAVSVEDLSSSKPLQASRKSVTKILGLFKKYEEQDNKRKDKVVKKTKNKENGKTSKPSEKDSDKTTESVIISNNVDDNKVNIKDTNSNCIKNEDSSNSSQTEKLGKKERPRSLLFDKVKHFQNTYNGARSDTVLNNPKERESKAKSKLPVNSFRRSLNLDNLPEPPKFYKDPSKSNITVSNENPEQRPDKKNLKLDFSSVSNKTEPLVIIEPAASSTSENIEEHTPKENFNSLTSTNENSTLLSPGDDYLSCDSWSVCSDFHHTNDLHSPVSPNGHVYSGDENESVIDRIRRKSFYTRFNEKKRPRRPSASRAYRDIDLGYKSPTEYSSLDRRNYDYRSPVSHKTTGYASSIPEPAKEYRSHNRSSSLLNDYVNVPNRYQTYNSKIGRPVSSMYSDSEDNTLDDLFSAAKYRKYSSHIHPSRLGRTSVSPVTEYYSDRPSSSAISPTSSEPI